MAPKTTKEQACTAAVAALTEACEPPIIEFSDRIEPEVLACVPWREALRPIQDREAMDRRPPASGTVDVWIVMFADPPYLVTVLLDEDGTLCAAGLEDEIDLMG